MTKDSYKRHITQPQYISRVHAAKPLCEPTAYAEKDENNIRQYFTLLLHC